MSNSNADIVLVSLHSDHPSTKHSMNVEYPWTLDNLASLMQSIDIDAIFCLALIVALKHQCPARDFIYRASAGVLVQCTAAHLMFRITGEITPSCPWAFIMHNPPCWLLQADFLFPMIGRCSRRLHDRLAHLSPRYDQDPLPEPGLPQDVRKVRRCQASLALCPPRPLPGRRQRHCSHPPSW